LTPSIPDAMRPLTRRRPDPVAQAGTSSPSRHADHRSRFNHRWSSTCYRSYVVSARAAVGAAGRGRGYRREQRRGSGACGLLTRPTCLTDNSVDKTSSSWRTSSVPRGTRRHTASPPPGFCRPHHAPGICAGHDGVREDARLRPLALAKANIRASAKLSTSCAEGRVIRCWTLRGGPPYAPSGG